MSARSAREALRKHIKDIRDDALVGADAKRRAVIRELAEFALNFERAAYTNASAIKALSAMCR
jgi:hypothetical protein